MFKTKVPPYAALIYGITKSGPLSLIQSMWFEAKHKMFKDSARPTIFQKAFKILHTRCS